MPFVRVQHRAYHVVASLRSGPTVRFIETMVSELMQ